MKKIIACLITLYSITTYGMKSEIDEQQDSPSLLQAITNSTQHVKNALIQIFDQEYCWRKEREECEAQQEREEKLALQQEPIKGQATLQNSHKNAWHPIPKKSKYSCSLILKSAKDIILALCGILGRSIATPLHIFWSKSPTLGAGSKLHERFSNDLAHADNIDATQACFIAQAQEEATARNFQIKHSLSWGALATALYTGITYYKGDCVRNIAQKGISMGLTTALLAWLISGYRAQIRDIKNRQITRTLQLTGRHISPQETQEAYARITNGKFFNGLRSFGPFGLHTMLTMRSTLNRNFFLTTCVKEPTANQSFGPLDSSLQPIEGTPTAN